MESPGQTGKKKKRRRRKTRWKETKPRKPNRENSTNEAASGGKREKATQTYIRPLDLLLLNLPTRRREKRRPTPLPHRLLHERPHDRHRHLPHHPIRILRLLRLVRAHGPGVRRVHPRALLVYLGRVKAEVAVLGAAGEGADEKELGELGAGVEVCGADVGVELGEVLEVDGGGGEAVHVGGLEDEARVWGFLQEREEAEG